MRKIDTVGIVDAKNNIIETTVSPQGIWTRMNGIVTDMGVPIKINGIILQPKLFPYLYCLNDIHRACGYPQDRRPVRWYRHGSSKDLIRSLDEYTVDTMELYAAAPTPLPEHLVKIRGGKNRGSYGSILVALMYCGWLSPKFQIEVYSSYLRGSIVVDAEAAIVLTEDMADTSYILTAAGDMSVGAFAKYYKGVNPVSTLGRNKMLNLLREEEYLQIGHDGDDPDRNVPYQHWIDRGIFTVRRLTTQAGRCIYQPMVTPVGVTYLTDMLNNRI